MARPEDVKFDITSDEERALDDNDLGVAASTFIDASLCRLQGSCGSEDCRLGWGSVERLADGHQQLPFNGPPIGPVGDAVISEITISCLNNQCRNPDFIMELANIVRLGAGILPEPTKTQ